MFKYFLVAIVLIATPVYSQDEISTCGHVDDVVTPLDPTICKEDIAFSFVESVFPKLYREVLVLSNLNDKTVPEIIGELPDTRADIIFDIIFNKFWWFVVYLFGGYLLLFAVDIGIKLLTGSDFEQSVGGYKQTGSGFAIAIGMLLPYKTFFIGQLIVLLMSVIALSSANAFLSVFLNDKQDVVEETWNNTQKIPDAPNWKEGRNHFYSRVFLQHLIKMELCRKQTSNYLLTQAISSEGVSSDPKGYRKCVYGDDASIELNSIVSTTKSHKVHDNISYGDIPAFIKVDLTDYSRARSIDKAFSFVDKINFNVDSSLAKKCNYPSMDQKSYSCGSMQIHHPNWKSNPLVRLIGYEKINAVLKGVNEAINTGSDIETFSKKIKDGWKDVYLIAQKELNKWTPKVVYAIDDTIQKNYTKKQEEKAAKELIKFKNNEPLRQLASFYHLEAMNMVMVGRIIVEKQLQSGADILKGHDINGDFLSEGGQLKQLDSYFEKSKLLAQKLESIQCAMKGQEVKSANNMLSTLQGNALDAQGGNQSLFVCIDYSNNKMLGDPHTTNAEIDQDELDEWYKAKHDEFTNEFTQEVESLASRRVAVEVSLSDAIKDIRGTSIWAKIRQDGYLGLASYMYLINKETANNIDHFKVMTNNLSIQSVNIQDNMISNDVALQGLDDDSLKSKFPTYEHSNYSLYYDDDRFKGVDPLVSSYEWMKARLTQKREYVLNTGKTGDLEQTIEDILNIDKQFNTLGIGNYNNKINKAKCMTDSKFCPFPTGDPFIELTNVGHAMVTTSTSFFSFYFAIKGIKGAIKIAGDKTAWSGKLMGFMKNSNTQSGSVTNSSAMGKVKDVIGTVGLEAVDFVNASEKILDLIIAALGFIMVLVLVVGGFLAYGMPLVPYLFLHLNFLAWVMIVFMASFSVFLWSMYWVRLGKNKQILQRTAIHYGGQILLKPMFSLIALLFTWYFFYAANYIISATIGEFLSGVHVTGTFTSLYHVIIKWFVIFSVYALIIKLIISSVDQMTSDLFSKLGIEETTSKDRINDVIKLVLFEKGSSLAQKSLQKMSNQQTQNQKQYEKAMKIMREAGDKGND